MDTKMNTKTTLPSIALAVAAVAAFALPSNAEYALDEQPVVGSLHTMEAHLEKQLNRDYQMGVIDPYELANLGRDLDAIRVKEEKYRMSKKGMTPHAFGKIFNDLQSFQTNLENRTNEKSVIGVAIR